MKVSIVTTTIHQPDFLLAYLENTKRHNHDVEFIVIGDVKTPRTASEFCSKIERCLFMGINEQEKYLKRFPRLREHLPFSSISRQNIGRLLAYENEADIIIMLDDDNLATE